MEQQSGRNYITQMLPHNLSEQSVLARYMLKQQFLQVIWLVEDAEAATKMAEDFPPETWGKCETDIEQHRGSEPPETTTEARRPKITIAEGAGWGGKLKLGLTQAYIGPSKEAEAPHQDETSADTETTHAHIAEAPPVV